MKQRLNLFSEQADKAYQSFNQRFWYAEGGYLYDVVDGKEEKTILLAVPINYLLFHSNILF